MNTHHHEQTHLTPGHRIHPVTLLSAAVAASDKALMHDLEPKVDIRHRAYQNWEGRRSARRRRRPLLARRREGTDRRTHRHVRPR
jgi:hypothetical protein